MLTSPRYLPLWTISYGDVSRWIPNSKFRIRCTVVKYIHHDNLLRQDILHPFRPTSTQKPLTSRSYLVGSLGKTIPYSLEGAPLILETFTILSIREVMAHEKLLNMSSRVDWKVGHVHIICLKTNNYSTYIVYNNYSI